MRQYILRRILLLIPVLVGVSLIIFTLMRVLPGDVAVMMLSGGGQTAVDPEAAAKLRRELGLDRPIYVQYVDWVWQLVHLDAGKALRTDIPVFQEILRRLPLTLELAALSVIVSLLISLPIGVISALRQDTWVDYVFRVVSIGGLAMPTFWTGIILVLVLLIFFRWQPPLGYANLLDNPARNLQQVVWPVLVLGYYLSAAVSRMTRSCMLEVLRQDYIRTAWSKGLRETVVVYRHALKNALLPVVTLLAFQFGTLMGGAVVMETIFTLPGLGSVLVESIVFRDYPMVQTIVLLIAVIFTFVNLAVDILYAWLDPRIRYA
ncbi:MAG: ABC transporter permease [Chloroflexi bacterium]|nr:ABC transporter permease [Chloroflexota bacterium]